MLRGWRLVEKAGKGPSPERSGDAIGILIGKLDPHALAVMAHQFPCEADNMPASAPSRARARADRHCFGVGVDEGGQDERDVLASPPGCSRPVMQDPPIGASEPIFNVPRSVLIAAAIMVALQIVRTLLPDEAGLRFLLALAFIPARYSGAALELPGGYLTAVTSFVTYMLVHAGWVHLLVNLLWMAAFGSAVARRLGDLTFFYFSTLCGIAGALTHLAFHFGEMAPVVGASAAISGQMAASLRFVFGARPQRRGEPPDLARAPLENLTQTLSDRRILIVLALWVALNAIFGLGAVSMAGTEGEIAWEAHIGGFLFGLLCFGFFDSGSKQVVPQRP